jgi:hypothetical protein
MAALPQIEGNRKGDNFNGTQGISAIGQGFSRAL